MSRTINESIQELEKAREAIKTSLNEKLSDGSGGVQEPLKISQVAGYIDKIETGSSNTLNYLEWIKWNNQTYTSSCFEYTSGPRQEELTLTFKTKEKFPSEKCKFENYTNNNVSLEPKDYDSLQPNTEYTLKFTPSLNYASLVLFHDPYNNQYGTDIISCYFTTAGYD